MLTTGGASILIVHMAKSRQGLLSKRLSRALMEYTMISPGDRILMALSGGKDSLALAWFLGRMAGSFPIPFSVHALHVRSEVHPPALAPALEIMMAEWKIPLTVLDQPIRSSLRQGEDPNCFICARKRREALLRYAGEEHYQAVALGHHMDDILCTLLMNMIWKGETAAMPPLLDYGKGLKMIRPLCLIQEHLIEEFIKEKEWKIPARHCPWQGDDSRREIAARQLQELTAGKDSLKYNMYRAMSNINRELLP